MRLQWSASLIFFLLEKSGKGWCCHLGQIGGPLNLTTQVLFIDGSCDQSHHCFFLSVFNTHQCLDSIFPLLIATGEYLSAHHWQASLRVLLKWCYTGPSTCNCVAAVQSWPLKGQAVIYLKWQQPHFYLPAEQKKKKSSQLCSVSILTAVASLTWCLFHVFACCGVKV